jgi:membrane-associated protease RseP (regulator of RpoE activity)
MKVSSKTLLRAAGAGILMVAAAAPAWAQSRPDGFDKPLKSGRATTSSQPGASSTTTMMREDDGENSYELRIDGDNISAKVNGKEVPQDRIVREGNEVKIMGKKGEVLKTFTVPQVENMGRGESRSNVQRGARNRSFSTPMMPQAPQAPDTAQPPRKVMVGILMDKASEEQLKDAGVDTDAEAIVIQRVIPETPAERAGIQEGDLITEINGQKPATQEKLREVMQDKKPGDTVTFTVRRDNADKTIRVKLDKYDAEKIGPQAIGGQSMPGMDPKTIEKLKGLGIGPGGPNGQTWVFPGPNGEQQIFRGFGGQANDERLGELDKRMSELDQRLDKLNQQMTKLEKMIEKMDKQRGKDKD